MAHSRDQFDFRSVADKIVTACTRIRPGEVVQLGGGVHNFELLAALAAAVRRVGAFPELNVTSDALQMEMMTTVPEEHLRTVPPHRLRWLDDVDAMIVTDSVADPSKAEAVPQERRLAAHAAAEAVERRIFERGIRWAYVGYPTPEATKKLPTSFDDLWAMFWRAVDIDYEQLARDAAAVAAVLEQAERVRITTDQGTDLAFQLGDRPVLIDDGVISDGDVEHGDAAVNLPAGKVFVAPVEASVAGRAVFDFAVRNDKVIHNLELVVDEGRVTLVGAKRGARDFERALAYAHGDKDRIAEFAVGLNPGVDRFTGYPLTDEKRRGTIHLALGDNRLMGGNNASTMHWDLFMEKPTVWVNDEPLVVAGELRIDGRRINEKPGPSPQG